MDEETYVDQMLIKLGQQRQRVLDYLTRSDKNVPDELVLQIFEHLFTGTSKCPTKDSLSAQIDVLFGGLGTVDLRKLAKETFWKTQIVTLEVDFHVTVGCSHHWILQLLNGAAGVVNKIQLDLKLGHDFTEYRGTGRSPYVLIEKGVLPWLTDIVPNLVACTPQLKTLIFNVCYISERKVRGIKDDDIEWRRVALQDLEKETKSRTYREVVRLIDCTKGLLKNRTPDKAGIMFTLSRPEHLVDEPEQTKTWVKVHQTEAEDVAKRLFSEVGNAFWL